METKGWKSFWTALWVTLLALVPLVAWTAFWARRQAAQRLRALPGCGPGTEPGRHLGLLAALAPVLQVVHDVQLEVLQPQADAARPAGAGTAQRDMAQRQGAPQVPEPAGLQGVVGGHGRAHCPSQATAEVAVAADGDLPLRSACVPSWSTCPWLSSATR